MVRSYCFIFTVNVAICSSTGPSASARPGGSAGHARLGEAQGGRGWQTPPVNHFSIFVERAVMAPDISKIDPDRHPNFGDAAWNFRDEVLPWPFHGNSLSDPRDVFIPFTEMFRRLISTWEIL